MRTPIGVAVVMCLLVSGCSTGDPARTAVEVPETTAAAAEALTDPGCDGIDCCPLGTNPIAYTESTDVINFTSPANACVVALGGDDVIYGVGNGAAVLGGEGRDTIFVGTNTKLLRGGPGDDTIFAWQDSELVMGNGGDDIIFVGNGTNFVVPGPGKDDVSTGDGDDTVAIYDVCEAVSGERLDGQGGNNTLITPVPLAVLQSRGVTVSNFQTIKIEQHSCQSECVLKLNCSNHGSCAEGAQAGQVACKCDPGFSGALCENQDNPVEPCSCGPEAGLFSAACGGKCRFEIPVPVGIAAEKLALSAYDVLVLSRGSSTVHTNIFGQVTDFAPVAQVGRRTSGLGTGTSGITVYEAGQVAQPLPFLVPGPETGALYSDGPILLGDFSKVHDALWFFSSAPIVGNSVVAPAADKHSVVRDRSYALKLSFVTTPGPDVTTTFGQNRQLVPGRYGAVRVAGGSRLTLNPLGASGSFVFRSLTVLDNAEIAVAGTVPIVFVTDGFSFAGRSVGTGDSILYAFFGDTANIQGTGFRGNFLGSRANVEILNDAEGAFFGASVKLNAGARLKHVPFVGLSSLFSQPQDAPVTGRPDQGATPLSDQSESVATATRIDDFNQALTITFNDKGVAPVNPRLLYFNDSPTPCTTDANCNGSYCFAGRCGTPTISNGVHRIALPGASLMGWSSSIDKGNSFAYGGHVAPPPGWSAIWGDPSIASNQQTRSVYIGNLGGSETNFSGAAVARDTKPPLDGFCVARSSDSGRTFPQVRCFKRGICMGTTTPCTGQPSDCGGNGVTQCLASGSTELFYDGSAMVTLGNNTFFSSVNTITRHHEVWRSQNDSLDFQPLADLEPFDSMKMSLHPRLRASGQSVYIAGVGNDALVRISIFDGQTWSTPRVVSNVALIQPKIPMSDLSVADQFSFDVGLGESGSPEVRTVYLRRSGTCAGTSTRCFFGAAECGGVAGACTPVADGTPGSIFVEFSVCPADLPVLPGTNVATCSLFTMTPGFNEIIDPFMPVIKYGSRNRTWQASWLGQIVGSATPELETTRVRALPGVTTLLARLVDPQTPCGYTDSPHYWGDYYDLIWLGDGAGAKDPEDRFLATFPDNRSGCTFAGLFDSDIDVGAVTFR